MSYENAPATQMLATHCAVCRRPLVDSVSVETGMGPDCREKHGYNVEVPAEARAAANKAVNAIAMDPNGLVINLTIQLAILRLNGFHKLADVIVDRKAKIEVRDLENGTLAVYAPFDERFSSYVKKAAGPWCRWDATNKAWVVPAGEKVRKGIWAAMKTCFPNTLGIGPKGEFAVM